MVLDLASLLEISSWIRPLTDASRRSTWGRATVGGVFGLRLPSPSATAVLGQINRYDGSTGAPIGDWQTIKQRAFLGSLLNKFAGALKVATVRLSQHFFAFSINEYDFVPQTLSVQFKFGLETRMLSLGSLRVVESPKLDDVAFAPIIFD
jgi:hypothetical protein